MSYGWYVPLSCSSISAYFGLSQRGGTSLEDMNLVTSKTCTAAACDGARGATKQALLETIGYGVSVR